MKRDEIYYLWEEGGTSDDGSRERGEGQGEAKWGGERGGVINRRREVEAEV